MDVIALEKFWQLIDEKLHSWLEAGVKQLPNIAVAIIAIIIFSLIAKITGNIARKLLRKAFDSRQTADLLAAIIKVCVLIAGIFISLDLIGLKGTVTSLLAGAGIIGLAIGFAFQDMTENLIAGVAMGIRKPFKIGDVIETDKVFGTVISINLRNTLVETFYGQLEIIPNKILFRHILTNYSVLGCRRLEIKVGISYADEPEQAAEVIVEGINQLDCVIRKHETSVFAESFGESSINLLVWFWIDYPGEPGFMVARHKAIASIHKSLKAADITIPFPIRTLDFGIKGGEKLDSMIKAQVTSTSEEKELA